jgi:cytochrome c biogenesis protein CcmG/thiol:disulfide interchange protein DsbE
MQSSKIDLGIRVAIGVLVTVLAGVIVYTMQDHIVQAGDKAPDFTITTDSGTRMSPRDFGGRVLVLNFWASWCAPCVQEIPSLIEFQKQLAGSGVVVLGVSIDRNEAAYKNLAKRLGINYPTAWDPAADISVSYGTYRIPETYIIDKNGKVAQKFIGLPEKAWNDPEIVNYVKSLL